jgi:hypothetical protein
MSPLLQPESGEDLEVWDRAGTQRGIPSGRRDAGAMFENRLSQHGERAPAFPAVALHFKGCARTVPNDPGLLRLGLASSEKQIPQIVENVANSKH